MPNLDNLRVRQDAMTLAKNVYLSVKDAKDFALKDQIQRSAVSIPSNIAEWYERNTDKDVVRFMYIAKWSCAELKTQLLLWKEIYGAENNIDKVLEDVEKIHKMLHRFIASVYNNKDSQQPEASSQ